MSVVAAAVITNYVRVHRTTLVRWFFVESGVQSYRTVGFLPGDLCVLLGCGRRRIWYHWSESYQPAYRVTGSGRSIPALHMRALTWASCRVSIAHGVALLHRYTNRYHGIFSTPRTDKQDSIWLYNPKVRVITTCCHDRRKNKTWFFLLSLETETCRLFSSIFSPHSHHHHYYAPLRRFDVSQDTQTVSHGARPAKFPTAHAAPSSTRGA